MTDYLWAVFCLLTHHHIATPCLFLYLPPPASLVPFLHHSQALSPQTWNTILALINYNGKWYNTITSICTCSLRHWYIYCLMQLRNIKMRGKTSTINYKHVICFRGERKGNIYISCACANACLPLFTEESRGCGVLEMQTARKVCRATSPTDKDNHFAISEVNSSLHEFASL